MKTACLKINNNRRKSLGCAAKTDVHQNNGAIELGITLPGNAIDQELRAFDWGDAVQAVERPVNRPVTKSAGDAQDAIIPFAIRSAPERARILAGQLV